MNDSLPRMSFFKRGFILFALGLIVGVMGANSVADAAGIHGDRYTDVWLRVLCGFILGLATIAFSMVAGHFGALLTAALRQSQRRPNQVMALTLVICGAVCLLMAMAFEWYVVASSQVIRPAVAGGPGGSASFQIGEQKGTMSITGTGELHIGRAPSPIAHVIALCSFAAGAVLIALGVWSSMSTKLEGYAAQTTASAPVPA
jgi:hypothetical protein